MPSRRALKGASSSIPGIKAFGPASLGLAPMLAGPLRQNGVAAGLTWRCSCNFDDPESEVASGTLLNDSGILFRIPLHRELSFACFFCGA